MRKIISILSCWCTAMMAAAQPNVNRVEYYFNTDPGFGKGTPITITPAANLADQQFTVDLGPLALGINSLYLRAMDANGKWSATNRLLFVKSAPAAAAPNINKAEYFVDSDPGFGNATDIPLPAGTDVQNIPFTLDVASLTPGMHFLFVRTRDANGRWSVTNEFTLYKPGNALSTPNITQVEYFVDTDPGHGKATAIPVTPATSLVDQVFSLDLSGLTPGIHILNLRARNATGHWGVTNQFLFLRTLPYPAAPNITRAEYFLDNDPGFGNGINIPITPGTDLANISLPLDLNNLSEGLHNVYIRTQDALGKWSVSSRWLFVRTPTRVTANIVRMETFIDTDPGFGNAVPIALNPATNLPDFAFPLNITGLSAGKHRYYLRTQDANGKWSVTARDSFNLAAPVGAPFIQINSINAKSLCGDKQFKLAYQATGTFNPGNAFQVQLSDGSGGFGNPTVIGSYTGTGNALIDCTIPLHIDNGNAYRVRVVSTNPALTGATADTVFVLNDQPRFDNVTTFVVCQNETTNLNEVYNPGPYQLTWNTGNPAAAPIGLYTMVATNTESLLCKDTSYVTVKQDVGIWTGTANSDWHNAANWSNNHIPTLKTHVIIPQGTPNPCVLSTANGEAASIQVRSGAQMQAINGRQVMVAANCNPLPSGM